MSAAHQNVIIRLCVIGTYAMGKSSCSQNVWAAVPMFCEEVKDIAQISKVSLTRNDGVSDSSVYLIIVISYPGGKQNCTVLLEILGAPILFTGERKV